MCNSGEMIKLIGILDGSTHSCVHLCMNYSITFLSDATIEDSNRGRMEILREVAKIGEPMGDVKRLQRLPRLPSVSISPRALQ